MKATEEEQAAIRAMSSKGAESAPAAAGLGRAPALAWAGLRLAAMVLLAAGVGIGLGDGDEFDDVGCTVAQQPGGTSHGARSAQAGERSGGKLAGSEGGAAGASGADGLGGGPECEVRAALCEYRMADGQCLRSGRECRLVGGKAEMLKAETLKAEVEEPSPSLAAKVFELLTVSILTAACGRPAYQGLSASVSAEPLAGRDCAHLPLRQVAGRGSAQDDPGQAPWRQQSFGSCRPRSRLCKMTSEAPGEITGRGQRPATMTAGSVALQSTSSTTETQRTQK